MSLVPAISTCSKDEHHMRHGSKSLIWAASRLAVAGILVMVATTASAQEPAAPAEPESSQAAPQAEPQQAPAEQAAPQEAKAPRIFQAAWEIVVEGKAEANGVLELV